MFSHSKRFFSALCAAALLAMLATGAKADDTAITIEPGASMRARIDSAVARAATGGTFSIVEINGDFVRYRARVQSLITFLQRRDDEANRQIASLTADRREKEQRLASEQERQNNFLERAQNPTCGPEEMKRLKEFSDNITKEADVFTQATATIDTQLTDYKQSINTGTHDVTFLTPFSQMNEREGGKERPVIDHLTFKNGNAAYFDGSMNIESDTLTALREARDGFAANAEAARTVAERQRAITAAFIQQRNMLGELGTQKQHALLDALAVIDNSYEYLARGLTNAALDAGECAYEGKSSPIGALFVAISKATEAIILYKTTGQQSWSNFDVDKLEAYYNKHGNVDVNPAWLMLSAKSYLAQQMSKIPGTIFWEPPGALAEIRNEKELILKAAEAALSDSEKKAVAAMAEKTIKEAQAALAKESLDTARTALLAELDKPNKAQVLRTLYAEVVRLRGVESESAKALLQAAKLAYMDEIANVANGAVDVVKLRQLAEVVGEQRAVVRAADEALEQSATAIRELGQAGDEARDTISKINFRALIKEPGFLKDLLKKAGKGVLKGFIFDTLRSGAQSIADQYYGSHWINFYKAYMEVDATIQQLKLLNIRWQKDYDTLRQVEKELSDAIALRDTAARFYNRYLSKLQGTEGLHVAINEIPRDAKGGFTAEVKGTGALYGHILTLVGDNGYVDLEPATPLPSYDTIAEAQVREAVEQSGRNDTFTYKTPDGFEMRNICRAATGQASAGGKCNIRLTVYYK